MSDEATRPTRREHAHLLRRRVRVPPQVAHLLVHGEAAVARGLVLKVVVAHHVEQERDAAVGVVRNRAVLDLATLQPLNVVLDVLGEPRAGDDRLHREGGRRLAVGPLAVLAHPAQQPHQRPHVAA